MNDEKNPTQGGEGGGNNSSATDIASSTPENREGSINPSSPNDAITAPSRQATENSSDTNNPK